MHLPQSGGAGYWPMHNLDRLRVRIALTYLNPACQRLNFTIRSQALARCIPFEGQRAVGVEVEKCSGVFHVECRELIICISRLAPLLGYMQDGAGF